MKKNKKKISTLPTSTHTHTQTHTQTPKTVQTGATGYHGVHLMPIQTGAVASVGRGERGLVGCECGTMGGGDGGSGVGFFAVVDVGDENWLISHGSWTSGLGFKV